MKNTKYTQRNALSIGNTSVCPAFGVAYAAQGIQKCIVYSHGSSGCARIMKNSFFTVFGEHIKIATDHLKEYDAIYGGEEKFLQGIKNIFQYYNPDLLAIVTTCMTETIGDNMEDFLKNAEIPAGKYVVLTPTPGYSSNHIKGFSDFISNLINTFAKPSTVKMHKSAILPGIISTGDMGEIIRICSCFEMDFTLIPDCFSPFLHGIPSQASQFSPYGTPLSAIKDFAKYNSVFALGSYASDLIVNSIPKSLNDNFIRLEIPLGVTYTDTFIKAYAQYSQSAIPLCLHEQRTMLISMIKRCYHNFYGKSAIVFSDPNYALPLTEFLLYLGMNISAIFLTVDDKNFSSKIVQTEKIYNCKIPVYNNADLYSLEEYNINPDLYIGESHLTILGEQNNIPVITIGFPDFLNVSSEYLPFIGYNGALRFVERLMSIFSDKSYAYRR